MSPKFQISRDSQALYITIVAKDRLPVFQSDAQEHNFQSSLAKLRNEEWKRKHSYSLWQQEKNVFSVFSEAMFMQKVSYIHLNPVRANLVDKAVDYRWSSARFWQGIPDNDEPLRVDLDRIEWRRA